MESFPFYTAVGIALYKEEKQKPFAYMWTKMTTRKRNDIDLVEKNKSYLTVLEGRLAH